MNMIKHIGTKEVLSTPMNRKDYNDYRGWELPSDENGEDEGYLVEYVNGSDSNHKDHKGYISWSPKEQFDNAYKIAETWKDRLSIERDELKTKYDALKSALKNGKVPAKEVDILTLQASSMKPYLVILDARLAQGAVSE